MDSTFHHELRNSYLDEKKHVPLTLPEIREAVLNLTMGWPRFANGSLFVDAEGRIDWLGGQDRTSAVFGWLQNHAKVSWRGGPGFVTKGEFVAELRRAVQQYQAVELYPHYPPRAGHYYACPHLEPGDGSTLQKFLEFMSPATPTDRSLMQACLMTLLWGGSKRPAFLITASGRGHGKTTLAEKFAQVVGGACDFSLSDDAAHIKTELLSDEALTRRVAILDNVKGSKISSAGFESLITRATIDGHKMYAGNASRPNTVVWFITINGAWLSKDMAQRCVEIRLAKPDYDRDWELKVDAFLQVRRTMLLADLLAALQADPHEKLDGTRWATWEDQVLRRVPNPIAAQSVILERQAELDADTDEAHAVLEFFSEQLADLHYDTQRERVLIPSRVAVKWLSQATDRQFNQTSGPQFLNQKIVEGDLPGLRRNTCKSWGRGYVWEATGTVWEDKVRLDIDERLARRSDFQ